jgi:hypothetical protein
METTTAGSFNLFQHGTGTGMDLAWFPWAPNGFRRFFGAALDHIARFH